MERDGEEERARGTLLKVALTHHFAFEFEQAAEAYTEAFSRPCSRSRAGSSRSERIVARVGPFESLAPGYAVQQANIELCRHLYRGLVRIGHGFEITPDLAESFDVSSDGRTYRFHLRPAASWSDGAPVTADDFAFTWRQMQEDEVAFAFLHDDVESARALDGTTFEIRLREPRNYFLHLIGQPPFFAWPRHVYEQLGARWYESLPLVGNGPFVLHALDERRALLAASPTWHGPRGNVLEIEFEVWKSWDGMLDEWRSGHADAIPLTNMEAESAGRTRSSTANPPWRRSTWASAPNGRPSTTSGFERRWRTRSTAGASPGGKAGAVTLRTPVGSCRRPFPGIPTESRRRINSTWRAGCSRKPAIRTGTGSEPSRSPSRRNGVQRGSGAGGSAAGGRRERGDRADAAGAMNTVIDTRAHAWIWAYAS